MKFIIFGLFGLLTQNINGQDVDEIRATVVSLFESTDAQNWQGVKRTFTQDVVLDYSSMTGQAATALSPDQIVERWKTMLPGFDRTQHTIKSFTIDVQGDTATAACRGKATHWIGTEEWVVEGTYNFQLVKTKMDWFISKMKFNFETQTGIRDLPYRAMERAAKTAGKHTTKQSLKDKVRQFFKSLENEDADALARLFAEDAVHFNPYHSGIFPEGARGREEIRAYWKLVFPNFDGMQFTIEEIYTVDEAAMVFVKYQGNILLMDGAGVYKNDYYSTFKFDEDGLVTEYVEIFNPITAARAFGLLDKINQQCIINKKDIIMKKIQFNSAGLQLVGNLYYPNGFDMNKRYPAIIVSGSWTTVKEQMAGLYAEKLAEKGFITLAFDFRNFGESEGEPRFYESPNLKKEDIKNAVSFIDGLEEVDSDKIGLFGVCAGAMYSFMAASEDDRVASIATAASWLHDSEAVKLFYGGEEGVQEKIHAAQIAKKEYAKNGVIEYIPSISEVDESAAMFGPYDYYLNPDRGAISEWSADKFAVMSWEDWLTTDPMPSAKNLSCPTLMIHSDGAVLPQYTKTFFDNVIAEKKELYWMETQLDSPFHQFNYYDQEEEVNEVCEQVERWFNSNMK